MSDVIAIFGILLIIGLAFPALLLMTRVTLPAPVERARLRIERTPLRCLGLGLLFLSLSALPIAALLNVPGPGQFAGFTLIILLLTTALIGAAGMAARLSERLPSANAQTSPSMARFVGGATALELAVIFPVIGWLVVLPIALLMALGATVYALLHWSPRLTTMSSIASQPQQTTA